MDKIGVGIVTCNRPSFFLKCFNSIPVDIELVVVNDGADFSDIEKLKQKRHFDYIHNNVNLGVGKSKNILFKQLLAKDCDHIFLIEDDIVIKDKSVFKEYIKARNLTGIQHFNFGYHGPANKNGVSGGPPKPRFIVDYGNTKIAINHHSVGAFCYYTKDVLKKVGLIDEEDTNAFEHVDHDYRIAKAGYSTPYWNFADMANSCDFLEEIECSEKSSSIRPRDDWSSNIRKGYEIFKTKHNCYPAFQGGVPDTVEQEVKNIMKQIYKKYAKRN